nr:unnamed protein product [Callosobruchus chinensis]
MKTACRLANIVTYVLPSREERPHSPA